MRCRRAAPLLVVWLISTILLPCVSTRAASKPATSGPASGRKLIIGIVDQVTWGDILSQDVAAPTLRRLARDSAVGMMNVRTAGVGGAYLTIGAGSRASAPGEPGRGSPEGRAYDVGELVDGQTAGRLYSSQTGWATGDNAIVLLGIGKLIRQNMTLSYTVTPGLLGGALRRAGLRSACIGNADTQGLPHRELAAIGMDGQGLVDLGDVGADLGRSGPGLPYHVTTDAQRLLSAFRHVAAAADVIIIDFGETSRVAEYADVMPPWAAQRARSRAIGQVDRLLAGVLKGLSRKEWGVLLLTPTAREPEPEERLAYLTPVIFRRPDGARGLLTSPSTRRAGLVVNTDVAATVLQYFGVAAPPGTVGRPMRVDPVKGDALARVKADASRQADLEVARRYSFRWLAALAIIAFWVTAGMFVLGDRVPRWTRLLVRGLLLVLLAAPPALLLVGARPLSLVQMLGGTAALAVAIALIGGASTSWRSGHALPSVLLAGILVFDLLRGANMLQWSPLSYSAASGARFYGIGDEFGGAMVGAVIVAIAALLSKRGYPSAGGERLLATIVLLGVTALLGYSRYGANLGMALGCAVACAVFLAYLWQERPTWGAAAFILVLVSLAAAGAIAVDVFQRGADASHVGMLAATIKSEGPNALLQAAVRKWSMNWTLVRVSLWTGVVVAGFGVVGAYLLARPRRALSAMAEREWLAPAVIACIAGGVASWAFNDSGIVAAALVLLYGVGSLSYLGLGDA